VPRPWLLLILGWSVPGLLQLIQEATYSRAKGIEGFEPLASVLSYLPLWWPWILATPIVAFVARYWHPRRTGWPRSLAAHAAVAIIIGAAHIGLVGAYHFYFPPSHLPEAWIPPSLTEVFTQSLWSFRTQSEVLAYGVIVTATLAVDARDRVRSEEARALRLETQLESARLMALRSQLRPHFLFNALNSCLVLVREDPASAESMIRRIADLLRHSLESDERREVSLEEELDLTRMYLDVEEVRFADRLTVEVDAPMSLMDARVPPWILQPIVENAVRHGIAPLRRGGVIEVRANGEAGGDLVLTVEDSGAGIRAEATGGSGTRLGLRSTRERLAEAYGDRAQLELGSRADGTGTRVEIRLPLSRPEGAA
ncbi:MAG: histidine kinase, partial [Planctomycetota bacterium]